VQLEVNPYDPHVGVLKTEARCCLIGSSLPRSLGLPLPQGIAEGYQRPSTMRSAW